MPNALLGFVAVVCAAVACRWAVVVYVKQAALDESPPAAQSMKEAAKTQIAEGTTFTRDLSRVISGTSGNEESTGGKWVQMNREYRRAPRNKTHERLNRKAVVIRGAAEFSHIECLQDSMEVCVLFCNDLLAHTTVPRE